MPTGFGIGVDGFGVRSNTEGAEPAFFISHLVSGIEVDEVGVWGTFGGLVVAGGLVIDGTGFVPGAALYDAENKEGSSISEGMAVAIHSSGVGVVLAQADSVADACAGLMRATTANTVSGPVQTEGLFQLADWTAITGTSDLDARALYFLDPATPGMLTTTAPTTTGQVVQAVGLAVSSDTLDLSIGLPILL